MKTSIDVWKPYNYLSIVEKTTQDYICQKWTIHSFLFHIIYIH